MTRDRLFIPEGGAVAESTDRTDHGRCRLHPDPAARLNEIVGGRRPERPSSVRDGRAP